MSGHECPFTDAQIMALWAIVHIWGNRTLAAKLLAHAPQHKTETTA